MKVLWNLTATIGLIELFLFIMFSIFNYLEDSSINLKRIIRVWIACNKIIFISALTLLFSFGIIYLIDFVWKQAS